MGTGFLAAANNAQHTSSLNMQKKSSSKLYQREKKPTKKVMNQIIPSFNPNDLHDRLDPLNNTRYCVMRSLVGGMDFSKVR